LLGKPQKKDAKRGRTSRARRKSLKPPQAGNLPNKLPGQSAFPQKQIIQEFERLLMLAAPKFPPPVPARRRQQKPDWSSPFCQQLCWQFNICKRRFFII